MCLSWSKQVSAVVLGSQRLYLEAHVRNFLNAKDKDQEVEVLNLSFPKNNPINDCVYWAVQGWSTGASTVRSQTDKDPYIIKEP